MKICLVRKKLGMKVSKVNTKEVTMIFYCLKTFLVTKKLEVKIYKH